MDKKRALKTILWVFSILFIILFVYTLLNLASMREIVAQKISSGGYAALFMIMFILEVVSTLIGPGHALVSALILGMDFKIVLLITLASTTIACLLSYWAGYKFSNYVLEFIDKKDMEVYEKKVQKYGKLGLFIIALGPFPYIPALAGVFKIDFRYFSFVTFLREIKYVLIAVIYYYGISIFGGYLGI